MKSPGRQFLGWGGGWVNVRGKCLNSRAGFRDMLSFILRTLEGCEGIPLITTVFRTAPYH